MRAGEAATNRLTLELTNITSRHDTQLDDFARRLTQYGDWGNVHMTAYGTHLWWSHIEFCAHCREVEAQWQRDNPARVLYAQRQTGKAPKPAPWSPGDQTFAVDLANYIPELEPAAEVIELPVLQELDPDCVDCGDAA